jgi:Tol biopolymer transport system component
MKNRAAGAMFRVLPGWLHRSWCQLTTFSVLFLVSGAVETRGAEAPELVWPNTLRLQPLTTGAQGRDIVKLRPYDHIGSPSCSKDGQWAAFDAHKVISESLVSPPECFIVRTDGTGLIKLSEGSTPRWSPDGKRLLFMREGQGDPDKDVGIFVIDRDGANKRRISPGRWPDWSQDGSQIAYSLGGQESGGAREKAKIYIAQIDGSGPKSLCEGDCPSWSPDGRRIACCVVDPSHPAPEIRVVNVETGRGVTAGSGWFRPDWSPDGRSLVCSGPLDRGVGMVRLSADNPPKPPEALPNGRGKGVSPCFMGDANTIVFVDSRPRTESGDAPHTFDGRYDISKIDLTVVYLLPTDRHPLVDWRERVDYFMNRIAAFHDRESGGRSALRIHVEPKPVVAACDAQHLRGKDPNETFDNSLNEARSALKWPHKRDGFPIVLVLSEINWRELDDFARTAVFDGVTRFEGAVDQEGRHFPGAESGGSRATYLPAEGVGLGLVSADGWRVPYSGSECPIFHEGIGHPIGLPHPEPLDDSVMGTAQYKYWLNQTWLNESQKRALGWLANDKAGALKETGVKPRGDLFTTFTALQSPIVPKANQPVKLSFNWPANAKLRALTVRIQTDLHGPWLALPVAYSARQPPSAVDLGSFDRPTPVSYRVDARIEDGQAVELWGYFQVKPAD